MTKQQTFKTPKGTELPLLDLRGKPYLQVAHRLVWFREEHQGWSIQTDLVEHDAMHAIFRAMIFNTDQKDGSSFSGPHTLVATATGHETKSDFPDFIEKAETKAIGRALAMIGYGTQFAPELEEGERLADAPVVPARQALAPKPTPSTKDQLAKINTLAFEKLGVNENAEVLPAVNKALGTDHGRLKIVNNSSIAQEIIDGLTKLEPKQ